MAARPDAALKARAAAAHEILRNEPGLSEDERWELLELVVWPTPALEQVSDDYRPGEAIAARVLELRADGLSQYEIARQLGRPRSTVAEALRRGQRQAA
jgi:DNA-directed RNA polymerase specialized sigma24 family protein